MNWLNITKKFNNIKFKAGSWDPNEGLDCLSTLILFMKEIGKNVSKYENGEEKFEYDGKLFTKYNYADIFNNEKKIFEAMKVFVNKNCIKVKRAIKGDIIIFNIYDNDMFGIYLGQGLSLVVFEESGVKVLNYMPQLLRRSIDGYKYRNATSIISYEIYIS